MDKQNVPLVIGRVVDLNSHGTNVPVTLEKVDASRLLSYDPTIHEVVPKGMRETVEEVIADLLARRDSRDGMLSGTCGRLADRLQRALNGERA